MGKEKGGSLTKMLESFEGEKPQKESLDLEDHHVPKVKVSVPQQTPQDSDKFAIHTTTLFDWFEANHKSLTGISYPKVTMSGVKPKKYLIYKYLDPDGEPNEWGIRVIENADVYRVLDLPGHSFIVLTNGFMIVYRYGDKVLKAYYTKTGLIIVFCVEVEGILLIPYAKAKMKKRGKGINVPDIDVNSTIQKLSMPADLEAIQLLYPQFEKFKESMSMNQEVLVWFTKRQTEMRDVTHLLQIDNTLISLFA